MVDDEKQKVAEEKKKEQKFLEHMKEEFARRIGYQKKLEEKFEKEEFK